MSKDISKLIDRGNKAFGQQDYKRAQKLYEQALKLAPLDQTVIFNLGVAYQAEGNIDQAILCYQKIDKIADAKNNVGVIFENQGELEKAQEAYEAALKIDSNFKIAEENLNRLNRKMGLAPGEKSKKVTMADFTPEILESIRNSFAYQGLLRAFKNKIISLDDVKAEAETEAKNVNLPAGQRVHTVLVNDLGQGDLIKSDKEKGADVIDDEVNKVNKVNTVVNKAGGDELLSELKQKLGPDFGPGWQGIDKDGDLMEVLEVNPSGWLKFRVDRISGELDIFSYPFSRFIAEIEADPVYAIDDEDAKDLATINLRKLDKTERLDLIKKIHTKTLAKLQGIKNKQRDILEQVLKGREEKKMQEVLAKINE